MPDSLEDYKSITSTVREFVRRELYPLEASFLTGQAPSEAFNAVREKARASGLWLLDAPEQHGGAGLGLYLLCGVWQELYKAAVLPARNNTVFGPNVGPVLYEGTAEQAERYLLPVLSGDKTTAFAQTESGAGSDPASMSTHATWNGTSWMLNGDKQYITGADEADFLQVVAITSRARDGGRPEFSIFLVDRDAPGVTVGRCDETFDGELTWEVALRDVSLGPTQVIGEVGQGFRLAQNWLIRGRVHQAAKAIGIAERALAMSVRHAENRVADGRRLIDHQAVGFMLADSFMELEAARLMTHACAHKADAGADVRYDAAAAKIMAVESGCRIVDRAIQVHGGMGLMKDLPLAKWYWDLRSLRITEGSTEVMRNFITRGLSTLCAQ